MSDPASSLTPLEECRANVLDALQHLKDAHAALCAEDQRSAIIRLDYAQAHLTEAHKILKPGK